MDSLRRLVEQIATEVLRERQAAAAADSSPRPLVLLTGTPDGLEVILHQIERLHAECGPARAVLSESFRELVAPEAFTADTGIAETHARLTRAEAESLAARSSLLLVGTLSANSLAKIAGGVEDSTPSQLWAAARGAGLPLFVAEPPEPLATPSSPLSPARRRQREEMLGALRADGAQILPAGEVFARLQRFLLERGDPIAARQLREAGPRPIITAEDVERAHRRGMTEWALSKETIVTMAAHDRARDLGLRLSGGNLP